MDNLGKLEKVNLKDVWKHEEYDFSKWLSTEENLAELSDTIGIDIIFEERESSVGRYSVDIFANESGSDRKIIIENQLEKSDHDHLGKIITYAAGKDAKTIIWIVKKAMEEHRQAVDWLNSHTDEDVGIFLLEIELWKIGNSNPAPKFNIVAKPNEWGKVVKTSNNLTDTKKFQLEFWQGFLEYGEAYSNFAKRFNSRKAYPQHWYDISAGCSKYHISLLCNISRNEISSEIYISDSKEIYDKFYKNKELIEENLGYKFEWKRLEDSKASRIIVARKVDNFNKENLEDYYRWLCDKAISMKEIFNKVYNDKI